VVVAVIEVLPGLFALPLVSVKFTALAESVTLTDWLKTAFSVIVLAAELSTWPRAGTINAATISSVISHPSFAFCFIEARQFRTGAKALNLQATNATLEAPLFHGGTSFSSRASSPN